MDMMFKEPRLAKYVIGFSMLPTLVMAASPIVNQPVMPYASLAINAEIEQEQFYLGRLVGDPHMYEVTIEEEKTLRLTLLQRTSGEAAPVPYSLIVVRDNDNHRGVTEIGRLTGRDITWYEYYDAALALSLHRSETIEYVLTPGVYRFEVSTPENFGRYLIVLGTEPDSETGYFAQLNNIRFVQDFFEASSLRIIISSHILYPLGTLVLTLLIYLTWRRQRRITHA